jgi:hypothetical protein
MGLPLEMKPNYEDFSCQFRWVVTCVTGLQLLVGWNLSTENQLRG